MFAQQSRAQFAPMSAPPGSPRQGIGGGGKGGASSPSPAGGGKGGGSVAPPPWAEQAMRDNLQKASNMYGGYQSGGQGLNQAINSAGAYGPNGYQNYGSTPQLAGAMVQPRVGTRIDSSSANGLPAFNFSNALPVPTLGQGVAPNWQGLMSQFQGFGGI